jgi:hypothetical protein
MIVKVDRDRILVMHEKTCDYQISIWNIISEGCEFMIKYDMGIFTPFWLSK